MFRVCITVIYIALLLLVSFEKTSVDSSDLIMLKRCGSVELLSVVRTASSFVKQSQQHLFFFFFLKKGISQHHRIISLLLFYLAVRSNAASSLVMYISCFVTVTQLTNSFLFVFCCVCQSRYSLLLLSVRRYLRLRLESYSILIKNLYDLVYVSFSKLSIYT